MHYVTVHNCNNGFKTPLKRLGMVPFPVGSYQRC